MINISIVDDIPADDASDGKSSDDDDENLVAVQDEQSEGKCISF